MREDERGCNLVEVGVALLELRQQVAARHRRVPVRVVEELLLAEALVARGAHAVVAGARLEVRAGRGRQARAKRRALPVQVRILVVEKRLEIVPHVIRAEAVVLQTAVVHVARLPFVEAAIPAEVRVLERNAVVLRSDVTEVFGNHPRRELRHAPLNQIGEVLHRSKGETERLQKLLHRALLSLNVEVGFPQRLGRGVAVEVRVCTVRLGDLLVRHGVGLGECLELARDVVRPDRRRLGVHLGEPGPDASRPRRLGVRQLSLDHLALVRRDRELAAPVVG
mmetsp:Transcript_18428/g.59964  ORF Transcript_18428/g.59964 Transcript_18428/m.59964 type:complete len:280 (-) Transcript_18428:1434-2273(-)